MAKRILPSFTHIYQWSLSHIRVLKVLHLLFRAIHTYNILDTSSGFLCFDLTICPDSVSYQIIENSCMNLNGCTLSHFMNA